MSIQEIEDAVVKLRPDELAQFADWFANHHADQWDKQIADDSRSGKFAELIDEAIRDFDSGNAKPL